MTSCGRRQKLELILGDQRSEVRLGGTPSSRRSFTAALEIVPISTLQIDCDDYYYDHDYDDEDHACHRYYGDDYY